MKALTSKRHREDFKSVLETLENIGYKNYYAVLNAKNYGIPKTVIVCLSYQFEKILTEGVTFPNRSNLN